MDIHIVIASYSYIATYVTNLGTQISHILQLSQDMQFVYSYITINQLTLHSCTMYSLQIVLFMHTLISDLDLHNNISCFTFNLDNINHAMHFQQQLLMNACIKWHLSTQLTSCRVQLCILILYTIARQLLWYESCMLGHQYIKVWLCPCSGIIASVYNAKSSDISSIVHYFTRDQLRRLVYESSESQSPLSHN